jgi:hypothetical protein
MADIIITKKQLNLIKEQEVLNESLLSFENVLMAAGFIPVIGELADIALICYYLYKGQKLYAALMLIALIPTVGDFIVKPIIKLFQGSKQGAVALKTGGVKLTEYLAKNPEAATKFAKLGKYVKTPAVEKTVQGITKVNANLGSKLKSGLSQISGGSVIAGTKAAAKEVAVGGKFGKGLKDYFQGERMTNYFIKHGVVPEKGIKRWWMNIQAGGDRRAAFRKFISTNNLLAYFGIPSLTTFERKMSEDAEFRKKIADDPKTSDYIAQNFDEDSKKSLESEKSSESSNNTEQSTQTTSNKKDNPISDLFGSIFSGQLGKTALTAI